MLLLKLDSYKVIIGDITLNFITFTDQRVNIMNCSYLEEELSHVLEEIKDEDLKDLVVFNDDINTFEHVISTLIKVCNHRPEQAEQCTWIIHYKGKCCVKKGSFPELKPMKEAILDHGINAAVV